MLIILDISVKGNLCVITSCTCPGDEVVFECNATGGLATICTDKR